MNLAKKSTVVLLSATMFGLHGCLDSSSDSDDNSSQNNQSVGVNTVLLNATSRTETAYADFASGSATATKDQNWHIGFKRFNGVTNSGISAGTGSNGGKISVCVAHKYEELYSDGNPVIAEFQKLTLANTLDGFNGVTKASCQAADYRTDAISPQIKHSDWLDTSGYPVMTVKSGDQNGWVVRSASGDVYARISVDEANIVMDRQNPSNTIYRIKIKSEKWGGGDWEVAQTSDWIEFTSGVGYWKIDDNSVLSNQTSAPADWDLSIQTSGREFQIRVNGGTSGDGQAAVADIIAGSGYAKDVTDPMSVGYTPTSQVGVYEADGASGVFTVVDKDYSAFSYSDRKMYPHFTTYLVKEGDTAETASYYKFQVVSYYGKDGTAASGNIYIRYQQVHE